MQKDKKEFRKVDLLKERTFGFYTEGSGIYED